MSPAIAMVEVFSNDFETDEPTWRVPYVTMAELVYGWKEDDVDRDQVD